MKIFIGCSSSEKIPEKYTKDCTKYLEKLLKENDLVFGAYNKGLMGISYDIAKLNNRKIHGICTKPYERDLKELNCTKSSVANLTGDRTIELIKNSDAIIFLPGGIGTMQELFSVIESKRNKEIDKPVVIYNSNNYYDETINLLDKIYKEKFTDEIVSKCYHISSSIEDTLNYLKNDL